MISSRLGDYADVNPLENITHRDLRSANLPGGLKLFCSQFSITSVIDGVMPLGAMLHSTDPGERKLINCLIKDAVVIMQTKAAAGAYRRISAGRSSLVAATP